MEVKTHAQSLLEEVITATNQMADNLQLLYPWSGGNQIEAYRLYQHGEPGTPSLTFTCDDTRYYYGTIKSSYKGGVTDHGILSREINNAINYLEKYREILLADNWWLRYFDKYIQDTPNDIRSCSNLYLNPILGLYKSFNSSGTPDGRSKSRIFRASLYTNDIYQNSRWVVELWDGLKVS
jgi:hypothetical protein